MPGRSKDGHETGETGKAERGRLMAAWTIAITDHAFHDVEPERAAAAALGAELRVGDCHTPEEVLEITHDADAVLNCYAPMPSSVIAGLEKCRIISRYGIGVDTVDLAMATARGILVTNVPDYCVDEVSDHALALLLASARKVAVADRAVRSGVWDLAVATPIHRLQGRVLGLIGLGKIARRLAAKAQALGLTVCGSDPYLTAEAVAPLGIELVELPEVLRRSDFVSLHAPLTPETRHVLNAETFALMKPGAFIINTARGPLIEEAALLAALANGGIAGAALDVVPNEPLAVDSPLRRLDNVILTPHIAYYSEESLRELQQQATDEVVRALRGEPQKSLVNREVLSRVSS